MALTYLSTLKAQLGYFSQLVNNSQTQEAMGNPTKAKPRLYLLWIEVLKSDEGKRVQKNL